MLLARIHSNFNRSTFLLLQAFIDAAKLLQGRLKILGNLGSDPIRQRKVFGIFQAFVLQPEDIQANLVALDKLIIAKRLKPVRLLPVVPVGRMITRYEVLQIFVTQRIGFEREVLVGSQVRYPKLLCPGRLTGRLSTSKPWCSLADQMKA